MQESRPSRTALRVAMRRASHQVLDNPKVFDDPIALQILEPDAVDRARAESGALSGFARAMRAFMAARSRYAEDKLARALERGVKLYVVLGAGLDTFAYRNPHASRGLRVFEVDYPATQTWKRELLAARNIPVPDWVTFAPVDFESQTLSEGLRQSGFPSKEAAFFSWLGVTMYLEPATVMGTFRFIASCGPAGGVAFDYAVPRESLDWMSRLALDTLAGRVNASGEPFRSFFASEELRAELEAMGFHGIEDLGGDEINARYFENRDDGLRVSGRLGRLMSAETEAP